MRNALLRIGLTSALTVALMIGSSKPTQAQLGVIGGIQVSALADLDAASNVSAALGAAAGYHVGLFAELGPLRPGVLYLDAGNLFEGSTFLGTSAFRTSYLAVPVDIKLSPVPALYFVLGPEFQLKASSGAPADFDDDIESLVVYGGAGVGLSLGPLFAEAKGFFSLSSLTPDSYTVGTTTVTSGEQKAAGVRISTGFKF